EQGSKDFIGTPDGTFHHRSTLLSVLSDVFDDDDRIVDHESHSKNQSGKRDDIDRQSDQIVQKQRADQGGRDHQGHKKDRRKFSVEHKEDQYCKNSSPDQAAS